MRGESRIAIFLGWNTSLKRKSLIAMSFARDDRDRARVSKYYFPPDRASSPVTFTRSTRIACVATCVCASVCTNSAERPNVTRSLPELRRSSRRVESDRSRSDRAVYLFFPSFFLSLIILSHFNFVF